MSERIKDIFMLLIFVVGFAALVGVGIWLIIFLSSIGWVVFGWILGIIIILFYSFLGIWVVTAYIKTMKEYH